MQIRWRCCWKGFLILSRPWKIRRLIIKSWWKRLRKPRAGWPKTTTKSNYAKVFIFSNLKVHFTPFVTQYPCCSIGVFDIEDLSRRFVEMKSRFEDAQEAIQRHQETLTRPIGKNNSIAYCHPFFSHYYNVIISESELSGKIPSQKSYPPQQAAGSAADRSSNALEKNYGRKSNQSPAVKEIVMSKNPRKRPVFSSFRLSSHLKMVLY